MKRLLVVLVLVLSVLASSCGDLPKPLRWEIDTVSESIMPIADEVIVVYKSYLYRVITREQAKLLEVFRPEHRGCLAVWCRWRKAHF